MNVINETIENYSSSTALDVSDYAGTGASAYLYTHHQHIWHQVRYIMGRVRWMIAILMIWNQMSLTKMN